MIQAHPILSCAQSIALEAEVLGSDEKKIRSAMQRAGRMIGQAIMRDFREIGAFPERARMLVLAGTGHNAADAIIAADEIIHFYPYAEAHIVFVSGQEACRPLVLDAFEKIQTIGKTRAYTLEQAEKLLGERFDVCVDGLLGMSFEPPLRAGYEHLIAGVNAAERITFRAAVDLPSGCGDCDAQVRFKADFTYATGIAKASLFRAENAEVVGRVRFLDLGFFEADKAVEPAARQLLAPDNIRAFGQLRHAGVYKRDFGHLAIVGGSREMPGALLMSVRAALRSGVGLVTVFAPESHVSALAAQAPEAMWVGLPETPEGGLALEGLGLILCREKAFSAMLIGMGMGAGAETQALIESLVRQTRVPLVLDADALQERVVTALGGQRAACLTPHVGEWRRLTREQGAVQDTDLQDCSKAWGAAVLLKGTQTRLCEGGTVYVSTWGGPVLARGGSGDVLAGLAGGLLAARPNLGALENLCCAAVWHGLAADALAREQGQHAVTVMDMLPYLSRVIRDYEC